MSTPPRFGSWLLSALIFAGLTALIVSASLPAQQDNDKTHVTAQAVENSGTKVTPDQESPNQSRKPRDTLPNYGKTPKSAIPYRNFQEPYVRFFQKKIEFLGTGRAQNPAAMPKTVRIGFFGPVPPAPDADLGQLMLEGAQLAIEQANAAGGYQGIPFELVIRKDVGLWGASSNEMVAFMYEDSVLAVIGSINGANTHIALRVALKLEMPIVNTSSTDPTLTETNIPWLLRCMADDRQQGYALAAYMFGECRIKSVVALRCSDRYGRMGIMEFRDAATRLGFPLRAELQWKRGDRNFAEQLDKIAEIAPDAVVIWGNTADAAAVVKEIRRRKMSVRIFGSDRMARQEFLEATGEAAEGIVAAASYDPTRQDPKLKGFVKTYTELYGREPEAFAAHAYDGTNILIEAIRKAGLNRARIRDALYELTYYDGVTGPIEFDSTLNDIGPVYIAAVKNGRFVYREMEFAGVPATSVETAPYRTLAQSPPEALSPDDPVAGVEEVIRIGCFLPLDESGRQVIDGIRQAIAEDLHRNPQATPIELVVQDVRGAWGGNSNGLVNLIFTDRVLALVGSTERRGTHLAETLAAKFHFPVLSLCGTDPTITQIPLPWVFCLAQSENTVKNGSLTRQLKQKVETDPDFALGYDAASLLIERIRDGSRSRKELRDALAGDYWHEGLTGTFRFDALGNRIDYSGP